MMRSIRLSIVFRVWKMHQQQLCMWWGVRYLGWVCPDSETYFRAKARFRTNQPIKPGRNSQKNFKSSGNPAIDTRGFNSRPMKKSYRAYPTELSLQTHKLS